MDFLFLVIGIILGSIIQTLVKKYQKQRRSTSNVATGRDMKMIIVARKDLGMGPGKIAAQCCHGAIGLYKRASKRQPHLIQAWEKNGVKKVVVRCETEQDLYKVSQECDERGVPFYLVKDAGLTQIAAGSLTVCAVGPAPDSALKEITGHFRLL